MLVMYYVKVQDGLQHMFMVMMAAAWPSAQQSAELQVCIPGGTSVRQAPGAKRSQEGYYDATLGTFVSHGFSRAWIRRG